MDVRPYEFRVDNFHHPYMIFEDSFHWPAIHLDHLRDDEIIRIMEILQERIPDFISDCQILTEEVSQRSLQLKLGRLLKIEERDYLYLFKVSVEYMGGASSEEILRPHRQGISPEFITNRIYYHALILPLSRVELNSGRIKNYVTHSIKEAIFQYIPENMERDIWSSIVFDKLDFSEVNHRFTQLLESITTTWKPGKIFDPFIIEDLTLAGRVIDPVLQNSDEYHRMYDQLFQIIQKKQPIDSIPEEGRIFWKNYFGGWELERVLSRGGNPHWKITQLPDF